MNEQQMELYRQVILEHNKKPRNFGEIDDPTVKSEGYNPLCGDHLWVYADLDENDIITNITFKGEGCAISKASASMMTSFLKGKSKDEAQEVISQFNEMVKGNLNPESDSNVLGRLKIFAGIWKYPSRIKCCNLAWHAIKGALEEQGKVSTE